MRLSAILDFYYLEALRTLEPSDARNQRAAEKLVMDAERLYNDLCLQLALSLRDYLYLIAWGEARHMRKCATGYGFEELMHYDRLESYTAAKLYGPHNLEQLSDCFADAEWKGSYGGDPWARIAEAAMNYDEWPHAVFIDNIMDLAHNGGLCFDKPEVSGAIDLLIDIDTKSLSRFLGFKFACDILNQDLPFEAFTGHTLGKFISGIVRGLIRRYFVIWHGTDNYPAWMSLPEMSEPNPWPTYDRTNWGGKVLKKKIYFELPSDSDSEGDEKEELEKMELEEYVRKLKSKVKEVYANVEKEKAEFLEKQGVARLPDINA